MATTTNKNYILQSPGDTNWGTILNNQMISYVDLNVGGQKEVTVTATTNITGDDARNVIYRLIGALGSNSTVILNESFAKGFFIVENKTTGAHTVDIKYLSNATTVTVPQDSAALLICDSTNGVRLVSQTPVVTSFSAGTTGLTPSTATNGAVTLGGTLSVQNGGLGLTNPTNNYLIAGGATGPVNLIGPGATGAILVSNGTSWSSSNTINSNLNVTGNLSFNSGYGSPGVVFGCRAWANFNGISYNGTYNQVATTITVTVTNHNLSQGQIVYLNFTTGTAVDGPFTVSNVTSANSFQVISNLSLTTSGNVTLSGSIRNSGNVSYVQRTSIGTYTINFTNALPDNNYCVVGMSQINSASTDFRVITCLNAGTNPTQTTTNFSIRTYLENNITERDVLVGCVAVFR